MILVSTQKRIHVIATQSYEDQDLSATPVSNGMPDGMFKIIPSTNELTVSEFKQICTHPDFIKSFSRGHLFLIGKGEIVDKLPMAKVVVKVKQLKKKRAVGEIKGYVYSESEAVDMKVNALTPVFEKAMEAFPKKLSELKDLTGFENESHAMRIAEYTVDKNTLSRWLKAELKIAKDDQRDGVIDMLKATLAKVESFDMKLANARGKNEDTEE